MGSRQKPRFLSAVYEVMVMGSRQKPRFLSAVYEVISAEIVSTISANRLGQ
jgi:hypothetical protein